MDLITPKILYLLRWKVSAGKIESSALKSVRALNQYYYVGLTKSCIATYVPILEARKEETIPIIFIGVLKIK